MSGEDGGKNRPTTAADQTSQPPMNPYYGTFQGVTNYQPQPPPPDYSVIGIPQPVPPPDVSSHPAHYYPQGYHAVPGYVVTQRRPFREERLPCCGVGLGWCLFIAGFLFGSIPWYIGAFILVCVRMDYREKPGLIACAVAVVLSFLVGGRTFLYIKGNLILESWNCLVLSLLQSLAGTVAVLMI